jgi:alpha-L-fucosidase 2
MKTKRTRMKQTLRLLYALLFSFVAVVDAIASGLLKSTVQNESTPALYNVVWKSPSKDAMGSMPLGNGDVGLNAWIEPGGDLLFYISKGDAYAGDQTLFKLGCVRLHLEDHPLMKEGGITSEFNQLLDISTGQIKVDVGHGEVTARVWVDANRPVVHVEVTSLHPRDVTASYTNWRKPGREEVIIDDKSDRVLWYHRNESSVFPSWMRDNDVEALTNSVADPLLHRTFGAWMESPQLAKTNPTTLASRKPLIQCNLDITIWGALAPTAEDWLEKIETLALKTRNENRVTAFSKHVNWWKVFWNRSWIQVDGDPKSFQVSQGYALSRFIFGASCRGEYPPPYNGSIFNVGTPKGELTWRRQPQSADTTPDERPWGKPFMWQNTRLIYYPMPTAGDTDMMRGLFNLMSEGVPVVKARTQARYGFNNAAQWSEIIYLKGLTFKQTPAHLKRLWISGLETIVLMLDYVAHTQDLEFARNQLLSFANPVLAFYEQNFKCGDDGKMILYPTQGLEGYGESLMTNSMTDVAGLQCVLDGLLALPKEVGSDSDRSTWSRLRSQCPELPMRSVNFEGKSLTVLSPAKSYTKGLIYELSELYCTQPFTRISLFRPKMLEIARDSYRVRLTSFDGSRTDEAWETGGWFQSPVYAARLGLADEAAKLVTANFCNDYPLYRYNNKDGRNFMRFPAFWGANYDSTPDQCHAGTSMSALQCMLLQHDGRKIMIFPAWPKNWNVSFKLHAPNNTTVECVYRNGKVEKLDVTPASRSKDVVMPGE